MGKRYLEIEMRSQEFEEVEEEELKFIQKDDTSVNKWHRNQETRRKPQFQTDMSEFVLVSMANLSIVDWDLENMPKHWNFSSKT